MKSYYICDRVAAADKATGVQPYIIDVTHWLDCLRAKDPSHSLAQFYCTLRQDIAVGLERSGTVRVVRVPDGVARALRVTYGAALERRVE